MIYVETNAQNVVVYLHYMPFDGQYGLGKTEDELKKTGFLTDSLPGRPGPIPENQYAVLKFEGGQFSWEFWNVSPEPPSYSELMTMYEAIERGMTE